MGNKKQRRESKFKIQRQLGVLLPGLGDKKEKGPIARRPYPPGFHGKTKNRRTSEFGLRLKEKQKVRFHYGLKEKQVRVLIKKSKKLESNWVTAFANIIERRLDNIVFRAGFLPTIPAARQAVGHGLVLVNGKRVDIPSYIVPVGAEITLVKKMYENKLVISTLKEPTLELPHFLKLEKKGNQDVATLIDNPMLADIPFEFDHQYFIEFYGRVA
ncbi:30S ribosomal protein S4 [Candidatus Marinamargulisbacteria bacterium SCGC AG-343-D04]|nr:30S ribosomal protein S4 [Candidatus Marinamargulisbacteria bacterium SCGC AG-343-D04]